MTKLRIPRKIGKMTEPRKISRGGFEEVRQAKFDIILMSRR